MLILMRDQKENLKQEALNPVLFGLCDQKFAILGIAKVSHVGRKLVIVEGQFGEYFSFDFLKVSNWLNNNQENSGSLCFIFSKLHREWGETGEFFFKRIPVEYVTSTFHMTPNCLKF